MAGQSNLFDLTTSEDSTSATSSPGLADGARRLGSLGGTTPSQSGQGLVPASLSVRRVGVPANRMRVISGLSGIRSSRSANLQQSLANKLQERMDSHGSTLFALTWKTRVTPLRRRICALRAKGRFTHGNGFISLLPLPTPTAVDGKGSGRKRLERGTNNNLRDWFKINFDLLYPPVACVRYLMGYREEWDACAVMAMQSFPRSRRRSSKAISE